VCRQQQYNIRLFIANDTAEVT